MTNMKLCPAYRTLLASMNHCDDQKQQTNSTSFQYALRAVMPHRNPQTEAHKAKRTGKGQQPHNFELGKQMCWGD